MADTGDTADSPSLFEIRAVTKVFPGGVLALDRVNLEITEGECLVIAGSNGSGKTILMRILAGLAGASGGEVLFRGETLEKVLAKGKSFRQDLGIVFQDADAQFVGETAEEDVAFGPSNLSVSRQEVSARTREALVKTGLWEKRTFPPRRLSGGEKRRLAVAGVLAMNCRVIIMDEPFANLDWPGVVQVLHSIQAIKKDGKTLIILTHELEKSLALADRLVILDHGSIRDNGTPEAVLDRLKPEYGVRDPRHSYAAVGDCSWLD
ncbi:MAG: energy-coupling factor ABC transporter ATP-binding protein [Treponema sp.]|jgi:biotin transport system ATP-binding protein|nr:energy-coupling factor ABC transporter ATP-binding protein [Treponema sp.]